jgi:uncharacterized membrane protein YfcA
MSDLLMEGGATAVVTLIGTVVGFIPGLFGVGGGFLLVPLLHLFAGVPIHTAVGSCAAQSLGTVTTGMLHRRAAGDLHYKAALCMFPGTVLGLQLGISFLNWCKQSTGVLIWNGRELPRMEIIQLLCYLAIMLTLAGVTAIETYFADERQEHARRGWLAAAPLSPQIVLPEIGGRRASWVWLSLLGVVVGFLNGGFGMGGALLLVPGLVYLFGFSTHGAVAATLVSSWFAGLFSSSSHAVSGNVDLRLVCWLLLGGTLGSRLGSAVATRLSGRRLRTYFSAVILGSTGFIFYRLYELLFASR